jgi:uncharacterized protein
MRLLLDTSVLLYARGGEHPLRQPCQQLLQLVSAGRFLPECSAELVQEFAHVLLRRGLPPRTVARDARAVQTACRVHSFDEVVLDAALDLMARGGALGMRDAVHAATALVHELDAVVTTDRAFAAVPRLKVLTPAEACDALGA